MSFPVTDKDINKLPRNGVVSVEQVRAACEAELERQGIKFGEEDHRARTAEIAKFGPALLNKVIFFQRRVPTNKLGDLTKYFSVAFCVDGVLHPARVVSKGVVHRGGIVPTKDDPAGLAEYNDDRAARDLPPREGREGSAKVLIHEWEKVDRDPDTGVATIPPDAKRDPLFTVAEYIIECYQTDVKQRRAAGRRVLELALEHGNEAQIAKLVQDGAYVSEEDFNDANLPNTPEGLMILGLSKINEGIQRKFSQRSKNSKLRGKTMLNGLYRMQFLLSATGTRTYSEKCRSERLRGKPMAQYLDKKKPFRGPDGRVGWEPYRIDGELLSDRNVHKIRAGASLDCLMNFTEVNSGQGWSLKCDLVKSNIKEQAFEVIEESAADVFGFGDEDAALLGDAEATVFDIVVESDAPADSSAAAAAKPAVAEGAVEKTGGDTDFGAALDAMIGGEL